MSNKSQSWHFGVFLMRQEVKIENNAVVENSYWQLSNSAHCGRFLRTTSTCNMLFMLLFCLQVWLRLSFFLLRPQTTAAYFGETPSFIPSGCLRQVWTTNLSLKDNLTQPHTASFQSSFMKWLLLVLVCLGYLTSNVLGGVIGPVGFGGSLVQKESKKEKHTSIWFEFCLMK